MNYACFLKYDEWVNTIDTFYQVINFYYIYNCFCYFLLNFQNYEIVQNKFCNRSLFTHTFCSSSLNLSKQLNEYFLNFILWYSQNGGVSLQVEFYNLLAK
jgi:hypothetical protein